VYTAHLPSGDNAGALIDFHLSQSAWVSTFFCACATTGRTNKAVSAKPSFLIEDIGGLGAVLLVLNRMTFYGRRPYCVGLRRLERQSGEDVGARGPRCDAEEGGRRKRKARPGARG